MQAKDNQTGISLRFIRGYDATADTDARHDYVTETVWQLALSDERNIPLIDKLWDAREFVRAEQRKMSK